MLHLARAVPRALFRRPGAMALAAVQRHPMWNVLDRPAATQMFSTHKVYVGNMPYSLSEGDLSLLFADCGAILDVTIVKDKYTCESKGYGFVEFASEEAVDEALKLAGNTVKGRNLLVKPTTASAPAATRNRAKIYVGNIHYRMTESDVATLFAGCGPIRSLQLVKDAATARSRGYGFVEFEAVESAHLALALHGSDVDGRTLVVKESAHAQASTPLPPLVHVQDTILVANLPTDTTQEMLASMFDHCGAIDSIHMTLAPDASRAFATIQFSSEESATDALDLSGAVVDDSIVLVQRAVRRRRRVDPHYSTSSRDETQSTF
ncbi:Aste57867_5599 [Aphanomyces stellatus]|uniref:Aste57867_5599 protein n=1 Tax=Aphanomyces stellatus TaxID=120398 RepID=A0A485KGR0_9STRA|nr:hypothetical protein As57867_005586 [Aphanomyces stellatus]VFT82645.1 Aste57867_5599 [Aphanomyces stellatus]